MPDSFTPLDKGDLSLYQKKEKGDFELQKDQFLKWFNQEMFKDRQFQRIQTKAQKKLKEQNKLQSIQSQEITDQINFSKNQESINSSRIHSRETTNVANSIRCKNRNVFNIQIQTQFSDESFKCNQDQNSARKSSLQKIKSEPSEVYIKAYKSTVTSRESSQEITSPSSAFRQITLKKEQEINPFKSNSIQSVYQKHLIKQDFKAKNKNNFDGYQTDRVMQVLKSNSLKNNFEKTDYDFFLNKEQQQPNPENKKIIKPRLEILKKLQKPSSQSSLRQIYQQNNSLLQIDTSMNSKLQKESPKTQESYSQKLNSMLTFQKSPLSLKALKSLSTQNKKSKIFNTNYFPQSSTHNTSSSSLQQEYNSFNFFKKSYERKVLSKFEKEIFDPYKITKNKNAV